MSLSQNMQDPTAASGQPADGGSKKAPRCHIDIVVTPALKARAARVADELGTDMSSLVKLALARFLDGKDRDVAVEKLIRQREDIELERLLHGGFFIAQRLVAVTDPKAGEKASVGGLLQRVEALALREAVLELVRHVAGLIKSRRPIGADKGGPKA